MYKISLTYVPTNIFDIPEALVFQSVCNASPVDIESFWTADYLEN